MTEGNANASASGMRGASDLAVRMEGVDKWYGEFHALRNIDLSVSRGSVSLSAVLPVQANRP